MAKDDNESPEIEYPTIEWERLQDSFQGPDVIILEEDSERR